MKSIGVKAVDDTFKVGAEFPFFHGLPGEGMDPAGIDSDCRIT